MGVRIKLEEDAYNLLKSWKGERESFSDVVMKLASRPKLSDFVGILSGESGEVFEKSIKDLRKAWKLKRFF
ncbi:antitoxin VapB family protein [Candidatus Woesearchaeota archaeon]|nr:antitoxin VapB family protein [Candidatus Woesearchaeota archaeon]